MLTTRTPLGTQVSHPPHLSFIACRQVAGNLHLDVARIRGCPLGVESDAHRVSCFGHALVSPDIVGRPRLMVRQHNQAGQIQGVAELLHTSIIAGGFRVSRVGERARPALHAADPGERSRTDRGMSGRVEHLLGAVMRACRGRRTVVSWEPRLQLSAPLTNTRVS